MQILADLTYEEVSMVKSEVVEGFSEALFGPTLHAKRVMSLSRAMEGVLKSGSLGVTAIGHGLAAVQHLDQKHAVKQVDRLLSNKGLNVDALAPAWVSYVIGDKTELVINMDWTEFDECDQSMLVLALQTGRGRSTPLLWRTAVKSELYGKRNAIEDALVERLRELIPREVHVIIVADRGFCDIALYAHLVNLGFDYIIRFRSNIIVEGEDGTRMKAKDWVTAGGQSRALHNAKVTASAFEVPTVVVAHDKRMKEGWFLASSLKGARASQLKQFYGGRFSIEETFRDIKDMRYGMALSWTRIGRTDRRDRLFLLAVLAHALLTLLGQACESLGMDRMLKVNTSKKRQHSLFRQGRDIYDFLPTMLEHKLVPLLETFGGLIEASKLFGHIRAIEAAYE